MNGVVNTLPASLYLPALLIVVSLLGSAVLIIGFFVRYWMGAQEKKDDSQDTEIKKIREDLATFKAQLPEKYTLRDDFIREVSVLHLKIDRIVRDISKMSKLLGKILGEREDEQE